MIKILLRETTSVHFLACPHFKLESVSNLYQLAQEVASEKIDESQGELAPLIEDGDLIQTLQYLTQVSNSDE